eukprot:scaffold101885_cov18-Phaeocystis_antarctica.AAC.1
MSATPCSFRPHAMVLASFGVCTACAIPMPRPHQLSNELVSASSASPVPSRNAPKTLHPRAC